MNKKGRKQTKQNDEEREVIEAKFSQKKVNKKSKGPTRKKTTIFDIPVDVHRLIFGYLGDNLYQTISLRLVCKNYKQLVICSLPAAYLNFYEAERFQSSNPILRISYFTGLHNLSITRSDLWELNEFNDVENKKRSPQYLSLILPKFEPLFRLKSLVDLSLTNFIITPCLCDSLITLPKLKVLSLDHCEFFVKANGGFKSPTIKKFVSEICTRLTTLSLFSVRVIGGNAEGLKILRNKEAAELYGLNLSINSQLANLTSLSLTHRDKKVSYIAFAKFLELDMGIKEVVDISSLTNLKKLDLSVEPFYFTRPLCISSLVNLEQFRVTSRDAKGSLLFIKDLNSKKLKFLDTLYVESLSCLNKCSNLRFLRIRNGVRNQEDVELGPFPEIHTLKINCKQQSSKYVAPFSMGGPLGSNFILSVSKMVTLYSLDITNSRISNEDFKLLASLKNLKVLFLKRCPLLTDAFLSFQKNSELMEIDLQNNENLAPETLYFIADNFPQLTVINLWGSPLVTNEAYIYFLSKRISDIFWTYCSMDGVLEGFSTPEEFKGYYFNHVPNAKYPEDHFERQNKLKIREEILVHILIMPDFESRF